MKIGNNLYECDFCHNQIKQEVHKRSGDGKKGTASDMVLCSCGNFVCQKTRKELNLKEDK